MFGPYPNIPVVMKTSLLGASLKAISGSNALVMVVPLGESHEPDQDSTYFNIAGYFELPGTWGFEFPGKLFTMTGSYSRAICHEFKNPERRLGNFSVSELYDFIKATGRAKDIEKLMPYFFISRLEEKYPWFYSDTVFLSRAMGNIFSENMLPYDVLGVAGIAVLFVVLAIRSFGLWMYYLFWVFAIWFGRIGYHDPNLIMTNDGRQAILWSFWNGFIMKEGRLFLVISLGLSAIIFGIFGFLRMVKQTPAFLRRKD